MQINNQERVRRHYAKGFCGMHYQRHLAGKEVMPNA